jgi:hypothetical protein
VGSQSKAAKAALALKASCNVVAQRNKLKGGTQHELARVQDEGLVLVDLDEPGEVILLLTGVDERVLVVIKKSEESV